MSTKERQKLAANVSKMIGALKARSGTSPQEPTLGGNLPGANRSSGGISTGGASSVFRTPSRDRFSSPGSSNFSDEDQPFDGKSFNRSRRGSGDRTSQASLLDLPDAHDVFNAPGFGAMGPPMAADQPAVISNHQQQRTQQQPLAAGVQKPRPQRREQQPQSQQDASAGGGGDVHRSRSRGPSDRHTPHRGSSDRHHRESGEQQPHRHHRRSSRDPPDPRATPPISARSDTPVAAFDDRRSSDRPKPQQREQQYPASGSRAAEQPRKQQLHEGNPDARRSAPRRHESPPGANNASTGERSRSTQRRMQDAVRRSQGNATPTSRPRPTAAASTDELRQHQQRSSQSQLQQQEANNDDATHNNGDYHLPSAISKTSPVQKTTSPVHSSGSGNSVLLTPNSGAVPLAPPAAFFKHFDDINQNKNTTADDSGAARSTSPTAFFSSAPQQQRGGGTPQVGIRRKSSGTNLNNASTNSKTSVGGSGAFPATTAGEGATMGVGTAGGVAKAIAAMSANTTRHLLGTTVGGGGDVGGSGIRTPSPTSGYQHPPRSISPREEARNRQSSAFSLADFVRETSSQYDFNRAPSRMSLGGSQFGGSNDGGASTPVQMRGANLLDSLSEQRYPPRPTPATTAGVVDGSWLDVTAKQTTSGGLEKAERSVRYRIQHAALFRPRVWFLNNVLPHLRQHYLKEYASKKRKLFVECAEPVFRAKITVQHMQGLALIRCELEESADRLDLVRASMMWRTQVKGAFDRLVQQLHVEQHRKVEAVKQTVEQEINKGASALAEKTSFSYLHLHTQFGDLLLKRTKELYIYYFGIMASMHLKEEKERATIAAEQRFVRLHIEVDRIRFFIQHLELVEYENVLKYFSGEKRILESELRFKPKPAGRSTSTTPANNFSWKNAASASSSPVPFHNGSRGQGSGAPSPLMEDHYRNTAKQSTNNYARETPQQQHQQQQQSSYESTPDRVRKEASKSPFPLDALERQQGYRRSQLQQQEQAAGIERELQGTPAGGGGYGTTNGNGRSTAASRNPHESFMASERYMSSQTEVSRERRGPPEAALGTPTTPLQHTYPSSYQQSNPLDYLRGYQDQQLAAAQRATVGRMPPPALAASASATPTPTGSAQFSGGVQQQQQRLAQKLEYEEASFHKSNSLPSIQPSQQQQRPLGVEDRRLSDEEDLPLPAHPIRGGHLLPKIDPVARKAREASEGVVGGIMLVSNVMGSGSNRGGGPTTAPGNGAAGAVGLGGKLPPIASTLASDAHGVVSSVGRMLLGQGALPPISNVDLAGVPDDAIDDRRVHRAEVDTATALLLLLHKSGADRILDDEKSVRQSLAFYEQEDRKDSVTRTAATRTNRFFNTRTEKLQVEEQELRHELLQHERYEFGLQIQRQQWVEYFLLTTEESSERERIVGMSHLSKAIVAKNSKQEFGVTCLMQHQVLAVQQLHVFQRWFYCEVTTPTSIGLQVEQTERRERNKILMLMDKEARLLTSDARERRATRSLYTAPHAVNPVEVEALSSVEEVHRRNLARQYSELMDRFVFEHWQEPLERGVIQIARERWFRDLVRPSQHRIGINVSEGAQRSALLASEASERSQVEAGVIRKMVEATLQDTSALEQREFRRLTMVFLKERRQREARERESESKKVNLDRYLQHAATGGSGSPSRALGDALNKYMAATVAAPNAPAASRSTPLPDYSALMLRSKQHHHQQQNSALR